MMPSDTGVRIIVTTDVPCYLYCRLTEKPPRIHKKAILRRGISFMDDLRFCFTVYEDNPQYEEEPSLTHTFYKEDWGICRTKYFYFYGTINGQTCVSTSPLFHYHNNGVSPVPVPDALFTLNDIDPEYKPLVANNTWMELDLTYEVHPDSYGAILELVHTYATAEYFFAIRKKGLTYENNGRLYRNSITWLIVGLDANHKCEYKLQTGAAAFIRVIGYVGKKVHFLNTPVDIYPTVGGVYETKDLSARCPNAKLVLTDFSQTGLTPRGFSIRPLGSAKEYYAAGYHKWPFSALDADGKLETKITVVNPVTDRWSVYGYITENLATSQNGVDLGAFGALAWTTKTLGTLSPSLRFAMIEWLSLGSAHTQGARKLNGLIADIYTSAGHNFVIVHTDKAHKAQFYSSAATPTALVIAETF